jgi:hypothetical protein
MKKFLLHISLFILVLTAVNWLLFVTAQKCYYKDYHTYSLKFKSYLLADSHGAPLEQLTEPYGMYNFSEKSESYADMYRKIRFLIRKSRIDTIFLTADNHTLSPYRETANNLDASEYYLDAADYSSYYEYLKSRYLIPYVMYFQPKALSAVRIYVTAHLKSFLKGGAHKEKTERSSEWVALSEAERKERSAERAREQFPPGKPSESLSKTLQDIIKLCKDNHIVLIGIKFPMASSYLTLCGKRTFGADSIMRAAGVPILDFEMLFRDKNEFFENQDHLNEKGATQFVKTWLSAGGQP